MTSSKKTNDIEKEKRLKEKLEKVKQDLSRLQSRRKIQIGTLAFKYGLHQYSQNSLDKAFKKLARELASEYSN